MSTVLFVKANNRPAEESVSVKLYETFLQSYAESHPEDHRVELDLYQGDLPYVGNDLIKGLGKASKGGEMTAEEKRQVSIADHYLNQLITADKIVIAFPLWNLSAPAVLHTYLDYMHRPRKTFRFTEEGSIGLLSDKKVALLHASGGELRPSEDPEGEGIRFVKRHLHFFGISNITKVVIHSHHQYPDRFTEIVEQGMIQAQIAAKEF